MWTKRIRYVTKGQELGAYLDEMDNFHDFLIGSFSYDSQKKVVSLTIDEDKLGDDHTNSTALIWNLECEGVSHFVMQNMDGLSKWWISEIELRDEQLQFQLVNGYFSFKMKSFQLGIPFEILHRPNPKIPRLHIDYLFQEFQATKTIDEVGFTLASNPLVDLRFFGYDETEDLPYWISLPEGGRFETVNDLFDATVFDGKSLRERWSEVTIYSISGLSLDDWLTSAGHSVETHVFDPDEEGYGFFINGVELDGFVDEDRDCPNCGNSQCYMDEYDESFCPFCNIWMYDDWWDKDDTRYFKKRPLEPELLWRPNKELTFCSVVYSPHGKPYTYYCPDLTIVEGDWVLVPVGKGNFKKEARVEKVFKAPANQPPYPLKKIKSIFGKLPSTAQELQVIRDKIVLNGKVCDLSEGKISSDSSIAFDMLKTPIGHFWLELNSEPIQISVATHYPEDGDKYFVEGAYHIKPYQVDFENFRHLKICTDLDLREARMIDNLGGEHQDGYNWQLGEYDIGITAHPYSYMEYEVEETPFGLPFYSEWYDEYRHLYGFTVAWKYYVSDEDVSVWYNM